MPTYFIFFSIYKCRKLFESCTSRETGCFCKSEYVWNSRYPFSQMNHLLEPHFAMACKPLLLFLLFPTLKLCPAFCEEPLYLELPFMYFIWWLFFKFKAFKHWCQRTKDSVPCLGPAIQLVWFSYISVTPDLIFA